LLLLCELRNRLRGTGAATLDSFVGSILACRAQSPPTWRILSGIVMRGRGKWGRLPGLLDFTRLTTLKPGLSSAGEVLAVCSHYLIWIIRIKGRKKGGSVCGQITEVTKVRLLNILNNVSRHSLTDGLAHERRILFGWCSAPRTVFSKTLKSSFVLSTTMRAHPAARKLPKGNTKLGKIH